MISADDGACFVGRNSPQIRELLFASCYVYSPGDARAQSRLLCASIKAGDVDVLVDRAIHADVKSRRFSPVASFFPAASILVPVYAAPAPWSSNSTSIRICNRARIRSSTTLFRPPLPAGN